MFPDISCDDIFRLETARLWLRWLRTSDGTAVATVPELDHAGWSGAPRLELNRPGAAERFVLHARAANAAGSALLLGATAKNATAKSATSKEATAKEATTRGAAGKGASAKGAALVGIVGAWPLDRGEIEVGCAMLPGQAGRGLAAESLSAVIDACFDLTEARVLLARIAADAESAARTLERCGFVDASTSGDHASAGGHPRLFRRERSDWLRGRLRRLPGMLQQGRRDIDESGGSEPA